MDDESFIDKFLNYYAVNYGYYRKYPSGWYFYRGAAIEALITEREIRKKKHLLKAKSTEVKYLRATDLANFTFCPASFSIANTFEIEFPSGEKEREIGEQLHNKLKLLKRVENYKSTGKVEHEIFEDPIILTILESENIYAGHKENRQTFFNEELKIACEPDYIFKDKYKTYFVVEEKFHYKRDPRKTTFEDNWLDWNGYYDETHLEERAKEIENWDSYKPIFYINHQTQLISYLKCIKEYQLKYGYLVYWYYDYNEEQIPYIHKVGAKKIILNENTLNLFNNTLGKLNQLIEEEKINFSSKLSPYKCAGCVVNKYCGHKNNKYSELTFPYDQDYLKLYPAIYKE